MTTATPSSTPLSAATSTLRPPPSPYRAILWKELHEGFPWAAGIAILLLAALAWNCLRYFTGTPTNLENLLLEYPFRTYDLFVYPLAALFIAILQILRDRSRDLRAFLFHRPLTPTRIFLAKSLSGLLLYLLAVGVPTLLFILFCSASRRAGLFFNWRFTLPYAADFLTGLPYYFAGLLIAQRRARWYASLLLPLPPLLYVSYAVVNLLPAFSHALAFSLALTLLYALPAWGAYLADGIDDDQSPLALIPLRLILIFALTIPAAFIAADWVQRVESTGYPWLEQWNRDHPSDGYSSPDEITILPNGTLGLKIFQAIPNPTTTPAHPYPRMFAWSSYTDLARHPLDPQPDTQDFENATSYFATFYLPSELRYYYANLSYRFNESIFYRDPRYTSYYPPTTQHSGDFVVWYFLRHERYFLGFNLTRQTDVGTLGRTGFAPPGAVPAPIAVDLTYRNPRLLIDSPNVFYIDFQQQQLTPIMTVPSDETVLGASEYWTSVPADAAWSGTSVLTNRHIRFATRSGQPLPTLPVEQLPADTRIDLYRIRASGKIAVRYTPSYWLANNSNPDRTSIYLYSPVGELLQQGTTERPSPRARNARYFAEVVAAKSAPGSPFPALDLCSGLLANAADPLLAWSLRPVEYFHTRPFDTLFVDNPTSYYHLGLILPAPLFALLAYLLTRLYARPRLSRILWPLAAALFGPVALLAFLATTAYARRIPCPHCRRPRPQTAELCPHCQTPFPAPTPNNTEIFA